MPTAYSVSLSAILFPPGGEGSMDFRPTEVSVQTSRYSESALVKLTGIADGTRETVENLPLSSGGGTGGDASSPLTTVRLAINGTPVGGGVVEELAITEDGLVTLSAVDGIRNLLQNSMTVSFSNTVVTDAIRQVFEAANVPSMGSQDNLATSQPRYRMAAVENDISDSLEGSQAGMTPFLVDREFTNAACIEVLDSLVRDVNWFYYADAANTIHVEPELPTEGIDLQYILETSAGKQTPAWQSVRVVGGSEAAAQGGGGESSAPTHLLGRDPVTATVGEGDPTFEYTDHSIHTQENATLTAENLYTNLQRQQASGQITVVGRPDVRPLDAVTMPDSMGGATYSVGSVTHTITNTNGYKTTIGCEGVVYAGEETGGEGTGDEETDGEETDGEETSGEETTSDTPLI